MQKYFREIAIIAGLAVFTAVAFLFRDRISNFLSFRPEQVAPPVSGNIVENVSEKTIGKAEEKNSADTPVGQNSQVPSNKSAPPYTGRDPEEVRPVPEEVKLFTEDQRLEVYATLQMHGRTVKANPEVFNGWIQLGIFKKTIGDFEGARDAWEYAGVIQPLNSLSFSNLGELYWRYLHDYKKSEENFKTSIAHKPDDIQNHVSLAELYHYSYVEKKDQADDVLLDGLKQNPGNEWLVRRLAHLYEQRGELASSLEWWNKVLQISPKDEEVLKTIDRVKKKLGQ